MTANCMVRLYAVYFSLTQQAVASQSRINPEALNAIKQLITKIAMNLEREREWVHSIP